MRDREGFYRTITPDIQRGIARVIYASDTLAVLAVADSFYAASDYTVNGDGFVAFLVNSKMVRAMLVDDSFLERLMLTTDKATLSQMMFRLTEKTFQKLCKTVRTDGGDALTHKFIDPELETWIQQTYGAPQVTLPQKKSRWNIFHKK